MSGSGNIRSRRLGGTIRRLLSVELAAQLDDPRLVGVGIREVELSADLSLATVVVGIEYGDDSEAVRSDVLRRLERLAPRLRSILAPALRMKRVPQLRFRYDVARDHVRRIDSVLEEIRREGAERTEASEGSDETDVSRPEPDDPKE